ncbi:hypothetical protein [Nocardia sp. NPDC057668]|uniref:hypothetical protein n=1 Tax=Nocardia sp. NPDC057668 TaxID=3346202 RepID=UPI00366EDF59
MGHRAELDGVAGLLVAIEFADDAHRALGVRWSPAAPAHKKLEYARVFLVPVTPEPERVYLELVDGLPRASVSLPESLPAGEYVIEVDAYGSASWGDGRLDAHGRSACFTVGTPLHRAG